MQGQCFVSSTWDGEARPYVLEESSLHKIDIGVPQMMRPILIDLAILAPMEAVPVREISVLKDDIPEAGTDVVMAGFPDDVLLPFHFDEHFEVLNPDATKAKKVLQEKFAFFHRQLLCKRAMIGITSKISINKEWFATYTLDSELTYGGSGGPVLDYDGRLVGTVIRKGLTSAQAFQIPTVTADVLPKLPSTTGYVLSQHFMFKLRRMRGL